MTVVSKDTIRMLMGEMPDKAAERLFRKVKETPAKQTPSASFEKGLKEEAVLHSPDNNPEGQAESLTTG